MNAQQKLEMIQSHINAGRTVFVSTALKSTRITPRTFANWARLGHELFKVKGDTLYMARGRSFDCIDYCAIQAR